MRSGNCDGDSDQKLDQGRQKEWTHSSSRDLEPYRLSAAAKSDGCQQDHAQDQEGYTNRKAAGLTQIKEGQDGAGTLVARRREMKHDQP